MNRMKSESKSGLVTKAGKTSVVQLAFTNSNESLSLAEDGTRPQACSTTVDKANENGAEWNVDFGCSLMMTPDKAAVQHRHTSKKVIGLANSLSISASHLGTVSLTIEGLTRIPALLVLNL